MDGARRHARTPKHARPDLHEASRIPGRDQSVRASRCCRASLEHAFDVSGSTGCRCPRCPQHTLSSSGTSSRSGMARSTSSGGAATRCACSRWHGASYATRSGTAPPLRGPAADRARSRRAPRGHAPRARATRDPRREGARTPSSSRRIRRRSRRCIGARPSNAAMLASRASRAAASPACACSAPQHRLARGATTRSRCDEVRSVARCLARTALPSRTREQRDVPRVAVSRRWCSTRRQRRSRRTRHRHREADPARQSREAVRAARARA